MVQRRRRTSASKWAILPGAFLLATTPVLAQRSSGVGQIDTNYVKDYSHLITGRLFSSTKFNTLAVLSNDDSEDLRYRPNNQINLGVGVSYRKLTLNLGFKAPLINNDDSRYGRTRYIDAQANLLSPERATNLFLQYFQGYHLAANTNGLFEWADQETDQPYRSDLRQFNAGISTLRMLNSERFSYRAAFNQDAWQRISQGSWMIGAYAVYYHLRADSSLVPTVISGQFGSQAAVRKGDFGDIGPMGGYAYTLVVGDHWFFTGSGAAGVGLSVQHVLTDPGGDADDREITTFGPGWHLQLRAGAGYNSKRQQMSITYNQERIHYLLRQQNVFAWSVGNLRFNLVYRFSEKVPWLDKAVGWLKRKTPMPIDNAVPATDQPTPKE